MSNKIVVALLCVVIGLLAADLMINRSIPASAAPFGGSDNGIIAVTGQDMASNADLLYLIDTKERTILAYKLDRRGLQLMSARTFQYDLYLDEWKEGTQDPSYKKIKELTKIKWAPSEPGGKKKKGK